MVSLVSQCPSWITKLHQATFSPRRYLFVLPVLAVLIPIHLLTRPQHAEVPNMGTSTKRSGKLDSELRRIISYAAQKYSTVISKHPPGTGWYPHFSKPSADRWETLTDYKGWTAGFYPGVLWQLYRLTQNTTWSSAAQKCQHGLRLRENDTTTHDVGFVIMSSFGLSVRSGFAFEEWKATIVQTAHSLATRFHPKAGILRSWDRGDSDEVTVIIDNMMNLDLLLMATKLSSNQTFTEIALKHADTTYINHFRPDHSTFHVVAYNEYDGKVMRKYTGQGYLASSTWARGQAWAIVGYAELAEWTGDNKYLEISRNAADMFIKRLPKDHVPFWDFDVGNEPGYQPRDTSAACIAAYGLLRLYLLNPNKIYLKVSEDIVDALITNFNTQKVKIPSILINGTVHYTKRNYDTAIIYGDFYLLKYIELYLHKLP